MQLLLTSAAPSNIRHGGDTIIQTQFCVSPCARVKLIFSVSRIKRVIFAQGPCSLDDDGNGNGDAREIERLARRVEQHSQRMAELLCRGVLEPSLAYAILMTKGGQRIPQTKSKANARASSRATTSEGAEAADDTSPPRLPPERPPMVFTKGETMEPSNARPKVRISRRSRPREAEEVASSPTRSLTPYLSLDTVSWPLHKDDGVSSSGHCCVAPAQESHVWSEKRDSGYCCMAPA